VFLEGRRCSLYIFLGVIGVFQKSVCFCVLKYFIDWFGPFGRIIHSVKYSGSVFSEAIGLSRVVGKIQNSEHSRRDTFVVSLQVKRLVVVCRFWLAGCQISVGESRLVFLVWLLSRFGSFLLFLEN